MQWSNRQRFALSLHIRQAKDVPWVGGREGEGECGGMWLLIVHLCGLITELNRSAVSYVCQTKPLRFESTKLSMCCVVYFDILDMLRQPLHCSCPHRIQRFYLPLSMCVNWLYSFHSLLILYRFLNINECLS